MSSFIINFTNTSNETGTIIADAGFNYTDNLNDINEANIKISGSGETRRGLVEIGSTVKIKRNGTLEFHGLVDSIDYLEGGGISVHASGYEVWLAKENGDYANSPWTSTASATIFAALIGESNYFTVGTVNAGSSMDFRAELTDSLWNAIANLAEKVQQDIGVDYANTEIDILDHKGSSTSVATFNTGIQIGDTRVSQSYPLGNDIRVYGKGDGVNQIKSDHTSYGQDATSKSTYGTIRKIVRDPSVMSQSEADTLADALVAVYKDPVKIYDFEVLNPNQSLVSGDVITLNAKSQGLSNEEVRIVAMEKGTKGGEEYLTLQVTNKEYAQKVKSQRELMARIERNARDQQTYMQGTTNVLTFADMINANNSVPLRVYAQLPSAFITDEAGNLRVNTFTLDYDIDKYRRGVATASESSVAPDVSGSSTGQGADVTGSSTTKTGQDVAGNSTTKTGQDVAGNSATKTGQGVSGTSSVEWTGSSLGSHINTGVSCSNGVWTQVAFLANKTSTNAHVWGYIWGNSGGAEDIQIMIVHDGWLATKPPDAPTGNYYVAWASYHDGFRDESSVYTGVVDMGYVTNDTISLFVKSYTGAIVVDAKLVGWTSDHSHGDGTYAAANHYHGDGTYGAANHLHGDGTYGAADHNHADGSYAAASHQHADGTYAAASHNHSVSVGDAVSDAGAVNASQLSEIKIYHWNGSSWDLEHTITNTGKTLDTDLDISDGGTLPDAAGFWKAELKTDNATPDLIQGIIKVKHALDA